MRAATRQQTNTAALAGRKTSSDLTSGTASAHRDGCLVGSIQRDRSSIRTRAAAVVGGRLSADAAGHEDLDQIGGRQPGRAPSSNLQLGDASAMGAEHARCRARRTHSHRAGSTQRPASLDPLST
jgi:hypothetical protein